MVRVALVLAYDGTQFRGFAPNPGVRTVASEIGSALAQVMNCEPTITCAGRTDKGVHARRQVVTFDSPRSVEPWRLRHSLNGLCGPEISVEEVHLVDAEFDARHSAMGREYCYTVENRRFADPLLRHRVWHLSEPLDVEAMNLAARDVLGTHDFSAFCRRKFVTVDDGEIEATRVRTVRRAAWEQDSNEPYLLRFRVEANAFCQQLVRSMVGTLVDIGLGELEPTAIPQILATGDRNEAGTVAPPQGLVLWNVTYPEGSLGVLER